MGGRLVGAAFSWEEFSNPTPFDRRAPDAAWVQAQKPMLISGIPWQVELLPAFFICDQALLVA
jgi:hypothetical protein